MLNIFDGCTELEEVDIPNSVKSIEPYAFNGCQQINTISAHWLDPITITDEVFPQVSSECFLYIPIGTSTKYHNAGWNFIPKMKETGILYVASNKGGSITYENESTKNESKEYFFTPYKSFTLYFEPDEGYSLRKVYLNGTNVISEINNSSLFIEEPEEDVTIKVVYADNNISTGDVNGDGTINTSDANCVANHILKNTPIDFYDYAADANDDDIINITDIVIIVQRTTK